MIWVSCCSLFECDDTTTEDGYEDKFDATEKPPVSEVDVYDMNEAGVYQPGKEFYPINNIQ